MKKFIALALALAMMVSCLVFTASAEEAAGVEIMLQGPNNIKAGTAFQVKVRVSDGTLDVGGVQAVVDATGATLKKVEVNSEVLRWNNTQAKETIYKIENEEDVTFAALNELKSTSYSTRVWFILDYVANEDADKVEINLTGVKVSDKSANLMSCKTKDLDISITDPTKDPIIEVVKSSILKDEPLAANQGLTLDADITLPKNVEVDEFGVVFYPTSLLGGKELTIDNEHAIKAFVEKGSDSYESIKANGGHFSGILNFGFNDETAALKFLGTRVTARAYYRIGDTVVYASNSTADSYLQGGTANKAALNTILSEITEDAPQEIKDATANLSPTSDIGLANRKALLAYVIEAAASSAN